MSDLFPSTYLCFAFKDLFDYALDNKGKLDSEIISKSFNDYRDSFEKILTTFYKVIEHIKLDNIPSTVSEFEDIQVKISKTSIDSAKNLMPVSIRFGDLKVFEEQFKEMVENSKKAINTYNNQGNFQFLEIPTNEEDLKKINIVDDERSSRGLLVALLEYVRFKDEGETRKIYNYGQLRDWFAQNVESGKFGHKPNSPLLIMKEKVVLYPRDVILYFQQFSGLIGNRSFNRFLIPVFDPIFNIVEKKSFFEYSQFILVNSCSELVQHLIQKGINPPQIGINERYEEGEKCASILLNSEYENTEIVKNNYSESSKDFLRSIFKDLELPLYLEISEHPQIEKLKITIQRKIELPELPEL